MIPFKLNGKPFKIASSWLDPTLDQYIKWLQSKCSTAEAISIFAGIDIELVKKASFNGLDMVLEALEFLKTPYQFEKATPNVGKYKLPLNSKGEFDIQFETLGQFEDMRSVMVKTKDHDVAALVGSYAHFVAIYAQKIRDGEYNQDEAVKMIPEIMQMPAHEVISVGSFFFVKLLTLLTGTAKGSQNTPHNPKKKQPVTEGSKKRLGRCSRSSKSRKKSGKK